MDEWGNHRKIIHVDMDAFYASVEQRDNPELRGKPVVVGGNPNSRGVVSTASYEARKFGIGSAMPLAEAYRRCPQAIFLPVNGGKYKEVSRQIRNVFLDYTPLVEPLALDEAFLDVTGSTGLFGQAHVIAKNIKERILQETGLVASVGLAPNKFLAKLASDLEKPNGFVVVKPGKVQELLDPLPVTRIWGVGKKTAERLFSLNIKTVKDLRALEAAHLVHLFGSVGTQLFELARGIDYRLVEPDREVKSIGRETTFAEDIGERDKLQTILLDLAMQVGRSLRQEALKGRTVTLKARYLDFRTISRSKTLDAATNFDEDIYREVCGLLAQIPLKEPLRLIGISVHNLTDKDDEQLTLFADQKHEREKLAKAIDSVNEKFGKRSLTRARLLERKR